jgi:hypothetical protein
MSFQITEAFVKQFGANVYHLAQQKGSKLRPFVRQEFQVGEAQAFERIGPTSAIKKQSRHGDTPLISTPHSRRTVYLEDYEWADLIDHHDKVKTLIDPTNDYVMAAMWAMGRSMDEEIIKRALGNAAAGKEGQTSVPLPNSQKCVSVLPATGAGTGLNVQALRSAKLYLDRADVDESIPRYIAVTAQGLDSLLEDPNVTSADFNTVRALVRGEIDTYMGFKFIKTQLLPFQVGALSFSTTAGDKGRVVGSGGGNANGYRRYIAWAQDGIIQSTAMDITARVSERADKSYSVQAYAAMSIGAVRMEEAKVVEILAVE